MKNIKMSFIPGTVLVLGLTLCTSIVSAENVVTTNVNQVCSKIFLFSDATTKTAGYTETNPLLSGHPLWAATYDRHVLVPAMPTEAIIPPWVNPATNGHFSVNPGASWVSDAINHPGEPMGEGDAHKDQWRLFKTTFTLPANAIVGTSSVFYSADNAATVYMNGQEISNTGAGDTFGPAPINPAYTFSNVFHTFFKPPTGRMDEVTFIVRNYEFTGDVNPTGLLYKIEINYCVPTTTRS